MKKKMTGGKVRQVTVLSLDEKIELYGELMAHTSAAGQQVRSFLHLKAQTV